MNIFTYFICELIYYYEIFIYLRTVSIVINASPYKIRLHFEVKFCCVENKNDKRT